MFNLDLQSTSTVHDQRVLIQVHQDSHANTVLDLDVQYESAVLLIDIYERMLQNIGMMDFGKDETKH